MNYLQVEETCVVPHSASKALPVCSGLPVVSAARLAGRYASRLSTIACMHQKVSRLPYLVEQTTFI